VRFEWPLTGRSQEMQLIDAALADPRSAGIVIFGAAGVGKTRIAREALEAVAPNGCQVRWVVGTTAGQQLPLGALASWASAPSSKQVVLGIDDAHLLDDLSVFVLHEIVQRNAAKLVLTVRTGDPVSASLQDLLNRCDEFTRLDLQPLSRDESATLASAALGGALERTAVQRLWQLTHGNALFMRSIVEHEVADGRLAQDNACWKWTGDPVVPRSLVELIELRLGSLPGPVTEVTDVLAVGEPLELGSVMAITDPASVEEAEVRGLITLSPSMAACT
jgi:hypothetical protein